ncbi:hypothetical protein L218DRAFT_906160 [Marasmius fiardii PR-910]|nr:hypothetical protein L218DRAFT_906160 [Marasmius fiardii PR-910]
MSSSSRRSHSIPATLSLDASFERLSLGDNTFSDTHPSLNAGRWPQAVHSDMFSLQKMPEILSLKAEKPSGIPSQTAQKSRSNNSPSTPSRRGQSGPFQTGNIGSRPSSNPLDSISEDPSSRSGTSDSNFRPPPTQRRTKARVSEIPTTPGNIWDDTKDAQAPPRPSAAKRRPRYSEPTRPTSDPLGPSKSKQTANGKLANLFNGAFLPLSDGVKPPVNSVGGFELAPHQKVGVAWMISQENPSKDKRGGILADDTGLGKTVQSCALIKHDLDHNPTKNYRKPTLVIVPNHGLGSQWESELDEKFLPDVRVFLHHGTNKAKSVERLLRCGVVLTTYATLRNEWSEIQSSGRKPGKVYLHNILWRRVILDEAHTIRTPSTKGARACCDLNADFRWCLSATPLQNDSTDLHSIFVFLQYGPETFANPNWYRKNISQSLKTGSNFEEALRLLHAGLAQTFLRRRKDGMTNGKKNLDLPDYQLHHFDCDLSPRERNIYIALQNKFEALLKRYDLSISFVLVLLLRLRQVCLHPRLLLKDYKEPSGNDSDEGEEEDEDGEEYSDDICQHCGSRLPVNDPKVHLVACKTTVQTLEPYLHSGSEQLGSERIHDVIALLRQIPAGEKTIVFSSFTSFFDILERFMGEFRYTRYDGAMKTFQRESALKSIKKDPSCNVILVSLKAGGVGLNIAECNHIILADIWWNPAVEEQAIGRVHRMGQTRQVHVYRLVMKDSIETRILELQVRKRQLAKAALDCDSELEAARKLSLGLNHDEAIALITGKKVKGTK